MKLPFAAPASDNSWNLDTLRNECRIGCKFRKMLVTDIQRAESVAVAACLTARTITYGAQVNGGSILPGSCAGSARGCTLLLTK
jgi:hypothetical protein